MWFGGDRQDQSRLEIKWGERRRENSTGEKEREERGKSKTGQEMTGKN